MAEERIQIPLVLENVLRYCLKDARERMEKGEPVTPFTALAVKETLFMEEHPGEEAADSFHSARRTVEGARGASAYGFCYDGYIDLGNDEKRDCIIAEGGCPGDEYGHAIGLTYRVDSEGKPKFADDAIYVSKALNYMASVDPNEEASDEEPEEGQGEAE